MVRDVRAGLVTDEAGRRPEPAFEGRPGRAIADHEHPDVRPPRRHDRQRVGEIVDVLLRGDPAHVADHRVLRGPTEGPADLVAGRPIGPEHRRVYSPLPEDQALKTRSLQLRDRRPRWHVRLARAVVEPSKVSLDHPTGPPNAIMPTVLVEVGVEARDDIEPALHRESQGAQAQRRFGGDVNQIRPEGVDRSPDAPERRQRQEQLLVEGQDDRTDRMGMSAPVDGLAVIRVDQLDRVTAVGQMPDQLPERPRDAVHLREVGFGDDRDAHGALGVGAVGHGR